MFLLLPLPIADRDYHNIVLIVYSWWFGITEEEWFDWKAYLLDGEEEEIIGLPNQQYQVQDIIINYSSASWLCSYVAKTLLSQTHLIIHKV